MKKTFNIKFIAIILTLVLAIGCLFSVVVLPCMIAENSNAMGVERITATFDATSVSDVAYTAAQWGGVEANGLWYYGESFLNLAGIKQITDGWNKIALSSSDPIIIAVIDTGIDGTHELFDKTLLKNDAGQILGYNAYAALNGDTINIGNISDISSKHGSSVAGVIAMTILELGLEDYIKIYPIKANTPPNSSNTEGNSFNLEVVAQAIRWASESVGADVINLSFGIQQTSLVNSSSWNETSVKKTLQGVINIASQTSVVVAAAGNSNKDSATDPYYPAYLDGVLSVMGYGTAGNVYSTSNFGAYDLIAPGEQIYTSNGYSTSRSLYTRIDGTSVAAPFVSLAAALLELRLQQQLDSIPSASVRARMMRNINAATISKGAYNLKKLEITTLLTQTFEGEEYGYSDPSGIYISDDGPRTDEDNPDDISMVSDAITPVTFVANLTPYGDTNPDLDGSVRWNVRDRHGNTVASGRGKTFVFTAPQGGTYTVTSSLSFGTQVMEDSVIMRISFAPYIASEVRVTYAKFSSKDQSEVDRRGVIYTLFTTEFSLTGLEYLDKEVEIKWYVNGEYVASGLVFNFKPSQKGEYIISAQYGTQNITAYSNSFVADVRSFMERPISIVTVCLSVAVLAAAALVAGITYSRRKH